jgi:Tol biopolymer transport system component
MHILSGDGYISPDKSKIVFTASDINTYTPSIYIANIDGSNVIKIKHGEGNLRGA